MSELLTIKEVAQKLRVHDASVRRWIKNGALEAVALPYAGKRHAYRVRRDTLDKMLGKEYNDV